MGELWFPKGKTKALQQKETILNDVQAERASAARDLLKVCWELSQRRGVGIIAELCRTGSGEWKIKTFVFVFSSVLSPFIQLPLPSLYSRHRLHVPTTFPWADSVSWNPSFSISRGGNSFVNLRTRPQATGHWPDLTDVFVWIVNPLLVQSTLASQGRSSCLWVSPCWPMDQIGALER